MCLYNGHKISPLGYFTAKAKFNDLQKNIKVFVVKKGGPPLLGRDFMSAFNLIITTNINTLVSSDCDVGTRIACKISRAMARWVGFS